jgi:hypothetical protein
MNARCGPPPLRADAFPLQLRLAFGFVKCLFLVALDLLCFWGLGAGVSPPDLGVSSWDLILSKSYRNPCHIRVVNMNYF